MRASKSSSWVPRRRDTQVGWAFTDAALQRATRFTNAGFVSTQAIVDTANIGTVGLSPLDAANANGINHPGLLERRTIGRELGKLVIDG
jgi:hypothetical protein